MALFLTIALSIWAAMHAYVFWRIASVPWIASNLTGKQLATAAVLLWLTYPVARFLEAWGVGILGKPLEYFGAVWMGTLFLLVSCFLVVDIVTLGGWLWASRVPVIRGWACLTALALSGVAVLQALRPPVVRDYEVAMDGLPRERDGLVVVMISDLHLGTLIGSHWLDRLVNRVHQMQPALIAVVGDVIDGNVERVRPMLASLQQLRAPLGVWAVTGNHEFYAGIADSVRLFEQAGFKVLRDQAREVAPGLVLAGIDDLTARLQYGGEQGTLELALSNRPPGATILLSHTPWKAEVAAHRGVGLMLSGHTHAGQVWPFTYLVKLRYAFLGGRYSVGNMQLVVCRGTGTWGPPMRLWHPSELVRITLRSPHGP
jgi:predicted MPP superfamily phosphohydrolase